MQTPPISDSKHSLRQQMRKQRQAIPTTQREQATHALVEIARQHMPDLFTSEVAGYVPVGGEIDIMPMMAIAASSNVQISLPCIDENNRMQFRRWQVGAPLAQGKYGIPAPIEGESVIPQIIILPLLACDMQGARLGAGGGYYDRTLAQPEYQACYRLGVGYHFQLLPRLPSEPHDVRVHGFLSEHGFQEFGRV